MNQLRNIIITSILLASSALLFAHGGFDHVTGTVVKLENSVLTVKTAKGDVPVTLDAKTEITQNDKPAQAADLKAGVRVVVDIPEGSKTKLAHSVKIGTAAKAEIEAAERATRVELKALAAKLAVDGAESLVARQMTPSVQEALISQFVQSLQGRPN